MGTQTSNYGMGNFYTLSNGKLRYRKYICNKPEDVYGKTKRECIQKMNIKEADIKEKETLIHPTDTAKCALLKDAIYYWLENYKKAELKPRSYDRYIQIYHTYIEQKPIGRISISNVKDNDIQLLLNEISKNMSDSTIKKVYELLNQFFSKHYYKRDPVHNPMLTVNKPKSQKGKDKNKSVTVDESQILTDHEMEVLMQELTQPYTNGKKGYKCGYFLSFLMWSYVRYGEALALQYKDIIFDDKTGKYKLNISEGLGQEMNYETNKKEWKISSTKTLTSTRLIPLHPNALECLTKWIELYRPNIKPNDYIFVTDGNKPIQNDHANRKLKQALKRCGIKKADDFSVHNLRHTGISYFLRHGADVKAVSRTAGHSDITITMRTYAHVTDDEIMSMFDHIQ